MLIEYQIILDQQRSLEELRKTVTVNLSYFLVKYVRNSFTF